ncbi:helix-turn-helix transcriptional regulator [Kozakia baliensis]|uniref:helix-turn-helix domain-containing protein n=1 Tax=Kozakia baliensis TaxID=153496 RepID=UPI00345B7EF7
MTESGVAAELRRRMEDSGYNQKSLALAASLNETYVRDILKGKSKNPEAGRLQRIANVLGCSVDDLMQRSSYAAIDNMKDSSTFLEGEVVQETLHSRQERVLLAIWRKLSIDQRDRLIGLLEVMLKGRGSNAA